MEDVDLAGQFSTGALNVYGLLQLDTGNGLTVTGSAYIDASLTLDGGTLTAGSLTGENLALPSNLAQMRPCRLPETSRAFGTAFTEIVDSTFTVGGTFNENGGDIFVSSGGQVQFAGLSGFVDISVQDASSSLEIGLLPAAPRLASSVTIDSGVTATFIRLSFRT